MRQITFVLLCMIFSAVAVSQSVQTGLPFLKLGSDARSTAMGEAFTSLSDDHAAFNYNPASLKYTGTRQLMVSHRQGFADVTTDYLGATLPGDAFTFGISALTSSVHDIEVRQRPGEAEGSFDARNASLGVGIAYGITANMTVGLAGKLLYEKIYVDEASGYAFDAGMVYAFDEEFSAGISILHLGSMSVLRSQQSILPATVRIGGSYRTSIADNFSLLTAGDIVKTASDNGMHLHAGAEMMYDDMLMLRAGYQTGYETRSISTGIGVLYGITRFDYSFVPMSGSFAPQHTFSLIFQL